MTYGQTQAGQATLQQLLPPGVAEIPQRYQEWPVKQERDVVYLEDPRRRAIVYFVAGDPIELTWSREGHKGPWRDEDIGQYVSRRLAKSGKKVSRGELRTLTAILEQLKPT